jgi:formylglycine-generating enzyme required for sulfatase activity
MRKLLVSGITCISFFVAQSQELTELLFDQAKLLSVKELKTDSGTLSFLKPLFSAEINKITGNPNDKSFFQESTKSLLHVLFDPDLSFKDGYKAKLVFTNNGKEAISLSNIIPFGGGNDHYYISGKQLADTSRSFLFQPNTEPIGVVLPHNNSDLNFSAFELGNGKTVFGLIKRSQDSIYNYLLNRTPYVIQPGKSISFQFYADIVDGDWHTALRKCFQEEKLYEVPAFNNKLYERSDLDYIRHSYTMHLMMAWEKNYYSARDSSYKLNEFLQQLNPLYGGDDIFAIWPTWPVLGLDQRTQWNLMRDLPGGLKKQKELSAFIHQYGGKYFISYNPWDDADEKSSLQKMSDIIHDLDADGVVLDTKAEASEALQNAADKAKPGVVLYSEGMAVPRDMQGIISGRVHNDIYYVPLLNLNKFIKPDFAIFRVAEVNKERIRREYGLSLFNGHGVEINIMRPGRPEGIEDDYRYWGNCVRILKENTNNFNSAEWTPLIPSLKDKVYVNKWPGKQKTIYTIFSLVPEGFNDALFEVDTKQAYHVVNLWNHEKAELKNIAGRNYIVADLESFDKKYLGTNNEGAVNAIGYFPNLLSVKSEGDKIFIESKEGSLIKVWHENPSYDKQPFITNERKTSFHLFKQFGRKEGKYIIQLFDKEDLLDEYILKIAAGKPLLVSESNAVSLAKVVPGGMVKIPAGTFTMKVVNGDEFISYPKDDYPKSFSFKSFYIDKYPVTNIEFKKFIDDAGYVPTDTVNYLKHWINGKIKSGEENFPVVNISYEDAQAYAKWAGKRLPTEAEWQYAAQTKDERTWPWGNSVRENGKSEKNISTTLTLIDYGVPDAKYCNTGDGKQYSVGKYKKGVNPFGVYDLTGSVWQMTNDIYQSDTYEYIMMKGGSYYKPGGSWWYVQGGPKPLHYRQMLLRVSQGFERNATVGFRCVKDAE